MAPRSSISLEFRNLRKGMKAKVVSIGEGEGMRRLQEMGLTVGTMFRVVKVAPLGDPVEIDVRGYRLCLRRTETQGIRIESVA